MREWILSEQNYAGMRDTQWDLVVLPFGATEPHNLHMPYGTDNYQLKEIGERACERAYQAGAKVLLLPTIPFGVNTNHLKVPNSLVCNVTPTTLLTILRDIVDSMERFGVKKMMLLNGHGGNELKPLTRELYHRTEMFLCVCDWYRLVWQDITEIMEAPGEHADEMESSLGLAYFPDLMKMELADEGAAKPSRLECLNKGWISISRPFHLVTTNTGLGNPKAATAEKGKELMERVVDRLSQILIELANAPVDDTFPY